MKRIITIAAVLFVAAAAQAASIDWMVTGANAIKNKAGGNIGAGWIIYLVRADQIASVTAAITDGTFGLSTTGVLGSALTSTSSNINTTQTATHPSLIAGTLYQYVALVFNNVYAGTVGATGDYRFSATSIAYPAYNIATDPPTQVSFTAPNMAANPWTSYIVVPEPTAAALLALGLAAVGLRRRFRK